MSYCFDVTAKAWARIRQQLPENAQGSELLYRFETMLEELHECDHRLRGQINHDERISKVARRLDAAVSGGE